MLSTSTAHNNTRSITCVISDHIRKKPQPKTTPAHQGMKTSSAELHSLNNPLEAVHVSLRRLTLDESSYPLKKGINSRNYADKADVERIRNETLKLLVLCLQCQLGTQASLKTVEKTATALEHRLFQLAPTLADYANVRTLECRLRVVLQSLRRQSKSKTNIVKRKQQEMRDELLQAFLGQERYIEIKELVQSLIYEKDLLVGSTCPKCTNAESFTDSFGSQLPEAVRRLYFDTHLLCIWNDYSLQRLQEDLATMDWNKLVNQARYILESYREWKVQQTLCSR